MSLLHENTEDTEFDTEGTFNTGIFSVSISVTSVLKDEARD